ncbi:MYB transcription factor [Quillaja saponaria]|uniref:MYB transcription factor n=1 Tax=Quillaja saponaria TaxID=32244 RepID=A0AAD7PDI5_QUISA|nr:MYB transcription factor [Quillaja saponaria]
MGDWKFETERKKDQEVIRKGTWKAEEDEVLINHVHNYGSRDWSSIRSKGLLQRTGKSCGLRWVNKLRPNLKNGCKLSLEEERLVIELQAHFGNKWARQQPQSPRKTKEKVQFRHDFPTLEGPNLSSLSEGESFSKVQSYSSSCIESSEMIKMVSLLDLLKPEMLSNEINLVSTERHPWVDSYIQSLFPQISQPRPDLSFSIENQDLFASIDDPNITNVFGSFDASEFEMGAQLPTGRALFEPVESCRNGAKVKSENPMTPESFFDDFPAYMFDHMEPPQSPSEL